MQFTREELEEIFTTAFQAIDIQKELAKHDKAQSKKIAGGFDAGHHETYSITLGRWTMEAIADIKDVQNWKTMHLAHAARKPCTHLHLWLQKCSNDRTKHIMNNPCGIDSKPYLRSAIQQLVYSKAAQFSKEYEDLLGDDDLYVNTWNQVWATCVSDLDWVIARTDIVMLVLEGAADYHMRMVLPTKCFPWLMAWLVFAAPTVVCQQRRDTAAAMLDLLKDPSNAKSPEKSFAFKAAKVFKRLFEQVRSHGTMDGKQGMQVYNMLRRFFVLMVDNTQSTEGMNSTIKHIKHLSPNINFPLLNARVVNRRGIALMAADHRRNARSAVLALCLESHSGAVEAILDQDRCLALKGPLMQDVPERQEAWIAKHALEDPAEHKDHEDEHDDDDGVATPLGEELRQPQRAEAPSASAAEVRLAPPPPAPEPDNDQGGGDMDADENTAEMWMRNNECAIKKCGYKFAAASQGVTPSFCYEVVAKHGRIVIRSEVVIVCFKYGYIPWFVLATVGDDDDAPPNWQVLHIQFPLIFKPLTEWAVFWHDLTMHEINGETAVFLRDVVWKLPSVNRALVSRRPNVPMFRFSETCTCCRERARRAGKRAKVAKVDPVDPAPSASSSITMVDATIVESSDWARELAITSSLRRSGQELEPQDAISFMLQETADRDLRNRARKITLSSDPGIINRELMELAGTTGALAESESLCMEEVALQRELLAEADVSALARRNNVHKKSAPCSAIAVRPLLLRDVTSDVAREYIRDKWAIGVRQLAESCVELCDRAELPISPWTVSICHTPLVALDIAAMKTGGGIGSYLVIDEHRPVFVHWDNYDARIGRVLRVDVAEGEDGEINWRHPGKKVDLSSYTTYYANTGGRMRRAEGVFRNQMPVHALVIHGYLSRLVTARIALINWNSGAGRRSVETMDDSCLICGRNDPVQLPTTTAIQLPMPCPCCGVCIHPACADSAMRRLVKDARNEHPADEMSDGSDRVSSSSEREEHEEYDPENIAAIVLSHLAATAIPLTARASSCLASSVAADGALPLLCATCRCVIPSL